MDSDFKFIPMAALSDAEREERLAKARQLFVEHAATVEASGLPPLSDEEIDAEIAAARRERDERSSQPKLS